MSEHSNQTAERFVAEVCERVRFRRARKAIAEELTTHIEDQQAAYTHAGMAEDEAALKAVESMGDPSVVGRQLDKTHRPTPEWSIIAVTVLVVAAGLFLQYALFASGQFRRYALFVPIGVMAFLAACFMDYTILCRHSKKLMLAFVVSCVLIRMYSRQINGTYGNLLYISMLGVPVYAAVMYSLRGRGYGGFAVCCATHLAMTLIAACSGSLSAPIQFAVPSALIMAAAVYRDWFKVKKPVVFIMCALPIIATALFVITSPHMLNRLTAMLHPESSPDGAGYMAMLVREVISHAQAFGSADMQGQYTGVPLERLLPVKHTDFLLTYMIGKHGLVAGVLVILLYAVFIWRLCAATFKQKTELGFIISLSAASVIAFQSLIYILANLWLPVFSLPLPLLSYGGISYVTNMALIGLVLSAFRTNNLVKDKPLAAFNNRSFVTYNGGRLTVDLHLWRK